MGKQSRYGKTYSGSFCPRAGGSRITLAATDVHFIAFITPPRRVDWASYQASSLELLLGPSCSPGLQGEELPHRTMLARLKPPFVTSPILPSPCFNQDWTFFLLPEVRSLKSQNALQPILSAKPVRVALNMRESGNQIRLFLENSCWPPKITIILRVH